MELIKIAFILCLCALTPIDIKSQDITQDDYNRAIGYMHDNYYNKTAFNLNTQVYWFDDGSGLWFADYSALGKEYKQVLFNDMKVISLFDHKTLAIEIGKQANKFIDKDNLQLESISKKADGHLIIKGYEREFDWDPKKKNLIRIYKDEISATSNDEISSPDNQWVAFSRDYNLWIRNASTKEEIPLSHNGSKEFQYASRYGWFDKMEGENGDRPARFTLQWSPDSKWIYTTICDTRNADKMYMLNWSIDTLYKPKLLSYYRGSPGDTNMVKLEPILYNIETKEEIKPPLPTNTHINNVSIRWSDKSGILYAHYAERGFQNVFILRVDLNTNEIDTLIHEKSETNVDNFAYWIKEDLHKIIFLSERSGWRQLYQVDLKTLETKALTKGDFYINNVVDIQDSLESIFFTAAGKDKKINPYYQQFYKLDKTGKITLLTPEPVNHQIGTTSTTLYFVDNISTVNQATKTVLRSLEDGNIKSYLSKADVSDQLANGWQPPEIFSLLAKDGKSTIYGAIWKPNHFDPSKSYPIIDHSYTGPHTQVFPTSFSSAFLNQNIAELGFVIMMVDGLGSSKRSKEFHNHSYKNMGNNLEDHVLAIRHLGEKYSWIDTTKVGIFGHSAGGYDAGHAMLAFPETYKVAVASSADHDFRMEKAWWPEMYMGWPVDSTYHEVSNITMAKNLQGKLLLIHGAMDDNVNASATFKFAEALVKANKEFDLLIFPSQRHGYRNEHRLYFIKKRWNYFVEHLRGVKPIWDIGI